VNLSVIFDKIFTGKPTSNEENFNHQVLGGGSSELLQLGQCRGDN